MIRVSSPKKETDVLFVTTWEDLTLGRLLKIEQDSRPIEVLRVLCEDQAAFNVLPHERLMSGIDHIVGFLGTIKLVLERKHEPIIEVGGKLIEVPKKVGLEPYVCHAFVTEYMQFLEETGQAVTPVTCAETMLSIWLYSRIAGKVLKDTVQIDEVRETVLSLPCSVALPLAAFFFRDWRMSTPSGTNSFKYLSVVTTRKRASFSFSRFWKRMKTFGGLSTWRE